MDIILLIVGAVCFIVSFIFTFKSEEKKEVDVELSNKQKEDMRNQIITIFDEQMDSIVERTEIELDKMANQKMTEMNEYSETILGEINRNHNEVMFLYDMLNEKKKEINNTVRDLNIAKKELEEENKKAVRMIAVTDETGAGLTADEVKPTEEKKTARKPRTKKTADEPAKNTETKKNGTKTAEAGENEPAAPKTGKKRTSSAKTALDRTKQAMKNEAETTDSKLEVFGNGNNNDRILELNSQGKSNIEIAKELGLGIGEVKLVVDLFRGGR